MEGRKKNKMAGKKAEETGKHFKDFSIRLLIRNEMKEANMVWLPVISCVKSKLVYNWFFAENKIFVLFSFCFIQQLFPIFAVAGSAFILSSFNSTFCNVEIPVII